MDIINSLKSPLRWPCGIVRGAYKNIINRRYIKSSEPFLSVDFWIKYADIYVNDNVSQKRIIESVDRFPEPVIFIETSCVFDYSDTLLNIRKPYRLITTCNDDISIPYLFMPCEDFELEIKMNKLLDSQYLLRWYTKNPGLVHSKIQALPLGPKWQWASREFYGENKADHLRIYQCYCSRPSERFKNRDKRKDSLLYFNFGDTTNSPFIRSHVNIRNDVKNLLIPRFQWNSNESFKSYMHTLGRHKFCVSPPGRGIDTHRAWEAIMSGTIPIMMSTPLDNLFADLPVVIVKDWSVINEEFLELTYEEMQGREYFFDICYASYWDKEFSLLLSC